MNKGLLSGSRRPLSAVVPSWGDALIAGKYYATPGVTNTAGYGNSELYAMAYWFSRAVVLTSIGVEVTTGFAAGAGRLGIFAAGLDMRPSVLILDAGAIDCSTSGAKEVAIQQQVGPGPVFFAYKTTAAGSGVVLRSLASTGKPTPGNAADTLTGITAANASPGYYGGTASSAGAMPNAFLLNATAPWTGSMPLVAFKVAPG